MRARIGIRLDLIHHLFGDVETGFVALLVPLIEALAGLALWIFFGFLRQPSVFFLGFGWSRGKVSIEVCHLDGGVCRFGSLVSLVSTATSQRLSSIIGGEDAKDDRYLALGRHFCDGGRTAACDEIKVRGFATNHTAESDDGVVIFLALDPFCGSGDFKGPGNRSDIDVLGIDPQFLKSAQGAFEQ